VARHYLDHASTSALRPEAAAAIGDWLTRGVFADPGRVYEEGRLTAAAVEEGRLAVAALLQVDPRQVVFTSGGTEAVNWANWAARQRDPAAPIALTAVEHSAVRLSAARGGPAETIPVDSLGRVDLAALDELLDRPGDRPSLLNCQLANHEVGTVQPVAEVVRRCREAGVPVHVDACAAAGHLPVDVPALGADLVSVSAHKMGGPAGVGALVVGRGFRPAALLVGGDQERARRAGMENVPAIVGFGAVARALAAAGALEAEAELARARTDAIAAAALSVPGVVRYGDPTWRLPHIVCFGVAGVEAEGVVLGLDAAGVAVHSGSACASEAFEPSPVLAAMGVAADHALRCSVGWSTGEDDVAAFATAFGPVIGRLRALAG
jgi:cysteine desulfurase